MSSVARGRAEIDAIDGEIVNLMRRRLQLSMDVQALRRQAGMPGIQHAREREVLAAYAPLGPVGVEIGLLVLRLCRGGDS